VLGSQKELHQIEQPVTVRKEVRTDVKQIAQRVWENVHAMSKPHTHNHEKLNHFTEESRE
jgi:hypothetical protein